jgi:heat-inducible transcriptional repressor
VLLRSLAAQWEKPFVSDQCTHFSARGSCLCGGAVYAARMMHSGLPHTLDARSRSLLRSLIAQYIADGQPVGSRTLAKSSGLDVSPATIRNIMSDLEDAGLVAAPHTSAGRVPTAQGYRVFVDSLLEMRPLGEPQVEQLRRELPTGAATPALLGSASALLSEMTRFVGVVSVPKHDEFPFRHIDFVALDASRVLVILVFTDGQVQNRIIETQHAYTPSELEQTANFLNSNYAGLRMDEIRMRLLREMREEGARLNKLLVAAIDVAQQAFQSPADNDMLVSGQTNLMGLQEPSEIDRLRDLFEAFQRKRDLLQLLERCSRADGVRLFIGEESGFAALDGYSLVTAPYGVGNRVLGVLGVIGPTRMAYERVIPVVATTAQLISGALNRTGSPQ